MVDKLYNNNCLPILWNDSCDIIEYRPFKKENGATSYREEVVLSNISCHISYKQSPSLEGGSLPSLSQKVKLFLSADVNIKPGSKISVKRNRKTYEYRQSGKPSVYSGHQEIELRLFEGWG